VTAGGLFRKAIKVEKPVQCVGVINAYHAMLAEASGFQALYLSGGGVAAASCGLPDLGITTMEDVLIDLRRITDATDLPVLVDIDTGWGGALNIARTVRSMNKTGAAGVHIEDQVSQKRCGHRPNKAVVSKAEMVDRIKAAVDAKIDTDFVIMARTDALAVEGMQSAIDRAGACVEAGADMIFPEAMTELKQYRKFVDTVSVPVLANITEFGATPIFTTVQLAEAGVSVALYPLSAFRAANKAAHNVYQIIRREGSQESVLDTMETREELYEHLGYHEFEKKLDRLFANRKPEDDES
jgi:methylisocitrate lyase